MTQINASPLEATSDVTFRSRPVIEKGVIITYVIVSIYQRGVLNAY